MTGEIFKRMNSLMFLFLIWIILTSSTYPQCSTAFKVEIKRECGDTGVLVLPEPGIKKSAYENLLKYFNGKCWDTYFLSLPECSDYSFEDYATSIEKATSKIVVERFAVISHGFSSLAYLLAIAKGLPSWRTVFISPVFDKGYNTGSAELFIGEILKRGGNVKISELLGRKEKNFHNTLSLPELIYTNDFPGSSSEAVIKYTEILPHGIIKQLNRWFKEGNLGDPLLFSSGKIKSLLSFNSLVISGQVDNLVPYYTTYLYVKNIENVRFLLGSTQNFMSKNYGRLSIIADDDAKKDIFPEIYRWIQYKSIGEKAVNDIPF